MQRMSARDAKNNFGRLIDIARAEPVAVEKHGRAVVVVVAFEEFERLTGKKAMARSSSIAVSSKPGKRQ
jgi:prevent-host-death family protein